jgi:hypothetical protein
MSVRESDMAILLISLNIEGSWGSIVTVEIKLQLKDPGCESR